jgi:DNA-binding response OmpR family regulator
MAGIDDGVSPSGGPGDTSKVTRKLRIMVVDDEADMVLTLMTLLREEGHETRGLYRATDVLHVVKEFNPDVVVLDVALPDGSGYALAEQIRRHYGQQRPMLIALTGIYRRPPEDHLSRITGCDHFLTKPFDFSALLKLIAPLTLPGGERRG